MSLEVHIEWRGQTLLVGRLHASERGTSVSFEYDPAWLRRDGAFAIDPASLPLQRGAHHAATLFGALQDCGPDRWGRVLIERAVRKKVLAQKPYRDMDYVLALDDATRLGALRFRLEAAGPFLAERHPSSTPMRAPSRIRSWTRSASCRAHSGRESSNRAVRIRPRRAPR